MGKVSVVRVFFLVDIFDVFTFLAQRHTLQYITVNIFILHICTQLEWGFF